MNPFNQNLRQVFLFSSTDLLANRAGRLSPRQEARQNAAGLGVKTGMSVAAFVLLGTLGVIAVFSLKSGTSSGLGDPELWTTLGIAGGIFGLIVVVSYFSSRRHLAATQNRQIKVAEGQARRGKIRPDAAHFEIKIGKTGLRLLTEEQLDAFSLDTPYRVYYLPGPIPAILSGEVIGTEAEAARFIEPEPPIEEDSVLQRQRKARPTVMIVGILAIAFPLVLAFASDLPGILFLLVLAGLFAIGIAFVFWALR
jgi:hypothetical protein